jgi:hypothetical protein
MRRDMSFEEIRFRMDEMYNAWYYERTYRAFAYSVLVTGLAAPRMRSGIFEIPEFIYRPTPTP